jgi:hypothetical protein
MFVHEVAMYTEIHIRCSGLGGAGYCNFNSVAEKAKTDTLDALNSRTGSWDQSKNTCVFMARECLNFDTKLAS